MNINANMEKDKDYGDAINVGYAKDAVIDKKMEDEKYNRKSRREKLQKEV